MWERIYAIYDRQARQIMKGNIPFVMMYQNDAVARREFTEMVQQIPQLQKHLDDYMLICLGKINNETGEVQPHSAFPAEDLTCLTMTARDAFKQDARQLDLTDERNKVRREKGAEKVSKEELEKTK